MILLSDKTPILKPTYVIPKAQGPLDTPAALEARRTQLEARLSSEDKRFAASVAGGKSLLEKLDHATENDRSYNDFSAKSFAWALAEASPVGPTPEVRTILEARFELQAEIESARRAKIKLEHDPATEPGPVEGVVWEVLGLFGLSRPK